MFNFYKQIHTFHDTHIRLSKVQQDEMRAKRASNLKRICEGLFENSKPAYAQELKQRGYAHLTMVQPPEAYPDSQYDIDNAVIFEAEDADVTPATAREWVRAAIAKKGFGFKLQPEVKQKCVRVTYADGKQCDFPVMRRTWSETKNCYDYELAAGSEWLPRDSTEITDWVFKQVKAKSPEDDNSYQLRRIIRMMKFYVKSHAYANRCKFPAGIVITALVIKHYVSKPNRDDESFRETLRNMRHFACTPVYAADQEVSDGKDDERINRLQLQAEMSLIELDKLDDPNTTEQDAYKAWKKVFRHSFFNAPASKSQASAHAANLGAPVITGNDWAAAAQLSRMQEHRNQRVIEGGGTKPWVPRKR